jgi:hypothetical protein
MCYSHWPPLVRSLTGVCVARKRFPRVTIGSLPDDILLDIFDFCLVDTRGYSAHSWHVLVHVCQKWRYIVFASPRRLDLRLLCTQRTPVSETLDVWPRLPIFVHYNGMIFHPNEESIIGICKRCDCVRKIRLSCRANSLLGRLSTAMQVPFPELTQLEIISSFDKSAPALPDMFLGGSAPRLQALTLMGIPFPALPKLPRSSHDLVKLHLFDVPNAGYISPEAMAACLSALTRLESFVIKFRSPASLLDRRSRRPPPLTRVVLLALTKLSFGGFSEYFEDLVAHVDTPVLCHITTSFFNQLVFDIPQFSQFIGRAGAISLFKRVEIQFHASCVEICFHPDWRQDYSPGWHLDIRISCGHSDWQISGLTQILNQFSPFLSSTEGLGINRKYDLRRSSNWSDDMDHMQWLELFHPFVAVQNLDIAPRLAVHIAPALRELTGGRVMEVLPELRCLSSLPLRGSISALSLRGALKPFITARQLANHPVTISLH